MTVKELRALLDWHHDDDVVVIDLADNGYAREITRVDFTSFPYRWSERKEIFVRRKRDVALIHADNVVVSQYPSY
jgi:hypothetical protein